MGARQLDPTFVFSQQIANAWLTNPKDILHSIMLGCSMPMVAINAPILGQVYEDGGTLLFEAAKHESSQHAFEAGPSWIGAIGPYGGSW